MSTSTRTLVWYGIVVTSTIAGFYFSIIPLQTAQLVLFALIGHFIGLQQMPPDLADQLFASIQPGPLPTHVAPDASPKTVPTVEVKSTGN